MNIVDQFESNGENILTKPSNSDTISSQSNGRNRSTSQKIKERNQRFKRVPLKDQNVISIEQEAGYHYRIVSSIGDRIDRFKKAGYEIAEQKIGDDGKRRSKDAAQIGKSATMTVGTRDGQPIIGVVMRIKNKWYEEDQRAKQLEIEQRMRGVTKIKGAVSGTYGEVESTDTLE